jgi:hypothetical protein
VASGTGVLEPDLEASVAIRLDPQPAVHIDFHGQLIAAVEVVSPRNKDRADAKETYTGRYLGYLRLGVHLTLVVGSISLFGDPQMIDQVRRALSR